MRYKKYEWNHKNINEIKYVFHTPEVEKECQSSHRHLDISYQERTSLCYCALSFLLMKANWMNLCFLVAQTVKNLPAVQET